VLKAGVQRDHQQIASELVTLVREQVGAGMNLYMLRRFVEYMNGAYGAEFPTEGGSRFWVRLPIAR